jgi:steroid delta-isomerase
VLGAFEQINLTANQVFPSGNQLTAILRGRGTGKNDKQVVFEGINVFEMNQDVNTQIMWGYWNPAAMMAQLQW